MHRKTTAKSTVFLAAAVGAMLLGCAVYAAEPAGKPAIQDPPQPIADVFTQGDGGYPHIRIPAIVTTQNGVLLAFAEGRQGGDHSENDIILRRSTDGGKSWGPVQVISEMGGDSLNDPCAVALKSGRVLLLFQRYPKGYYTQKMSHTERADPGYGGPTNTQSFLTYSDDDGATWSEPEDVTRALRREDVISVGSPGIGIDLEFGEHKGRIVWPLYEVMPEGGGDRYWHNCAAYSDDGGETWQPMRFDCGLTAPRCMGSIIACPNPEDGKQLILVSLPNTTDKRSNGTIFVSKDGGQTWPIKRLICPDYFGYSCLTVLPDGRVGCLYEREGTARTSLGVYDVNWLVGKTP